jgi:hypothetical protein
LSWDSDSESFVKPKSKTAVKEREEESKPAGKKPNRLSLLFSRKDKDKDKQLSAPKNLAVPEPEVDKERDDLSRVLDDLNLSAQNNTAFSLSEDSTELVRRFTLILKDLVNGVPTAVNDLTSLLDDPDGKLAKNYEKLPKSMKKLVTQLPNKLSSTLAPELLAVAAEAQGLSAGEAAAKGGLKGAAKRFLLPKNLTEMVTKPGAIVGMLKGIMNALKLRWPAFIGTNVLWSVALFRNLPSLLQQDNVTDMLTSSQPVLLFVLWYCHKRGREVRLEKEASENEIDGSDRIEELPDDPALPAPSSSKNPVINEPAS